MVTYHRVQVELGRVLRHQVHSGTDPTVFRIYYGEFATIKTQSGWVFLPEIRIYLISQTSSL